MAYRNYKKAKDLINHISNNPYEYYIIHYSCESFYDRGDLCSPRITSIAIRKLGSGQTTSFSIHQAAEKQKLLDNIEDNYNKCELNMLGDFFKFVENNKETKWIHWNMRDSNYGFQALEHRYEVLGGNNVYQVTDKNKFNLSELFFWRYGENYAPHPRMENLMKMNSIEQRNFTGGDEEAKNFDNKKYFDLHQSTLAKVDLFNRFLDKCIQNKLTTNTKKLEPFGLTVKGIYHYVREQWWWPPLWGLAGIGVTILIR